MLSLEAFAQTEPIDQLAALEVKFFAHTYAKQSLQQRTARLETMVFGSVGQETSMAGRLAKLFAAVKPVSQCASLPRPGEASATLPAAAPTTPCATVSELPSASYPRVGEIEQEVFQKCFEDDPIKVRVERLETKIFGQPCDRADLADRVDSLKYSSFGYARVRPQPVVPVAWQPYEQPRQVRTQFVSVVDWIESLENMAFGAIRSNKTLEKRVAALEQSFYGKVETDTNKNLTMRVSQLLTRMKASATSASSQNVKRS